MNIKTITVIMIFSVATLNGCGGGDSGESTAVATEVLNEVTTGPDPLYEYQWHLNNTGQTNFASNAGTSGEDINVDGVIAAGIKGNNVIVAVVDTGLEIAHEDLSANIVANRSWDFVGGDYDPTNSATDGDHGTMVAGLIAATGWNAKGGRGVAPSASLKGFNLLKAYGVSSSVISLGGHSFTSNVDIFNQSYGLNSTASTVINSTIKNQYLSGVTSLRGGKGAIYIKSSGNGFFKVEISNDVYRYCSIIYGSSTGLSCQNANIDPLNSIPYQIVVGALTAKGKKSSYSTAGSNLWASAPGGEYGVSHPAMMSTDQSGCSQGLVRTGGPNRNAFDTVGHANNSSCNYTSAMNGTSSAAPITSGVVALMLEANSSLTWRDVKHILASTSDQVDSTISATNLTINGVAYAAEPAWLTNAAGYKFHNYYGFGRINAGLAVSAAQSYTAGSLGSFIEEGFTTSGTLNLAIPDNDASGASNAITIGSNIIIEAVQVRINLTHSYTGELAIELTSPLGTRSMLFNPLNIFGTTNGMTNFTLLSNAFYGEQGSGNWTLKVVDPLSGDTGTLSDWAIQRFGH
jgi:subtilisin family serine protease